METFNFAQIKESFKMINLSLEKGCKAGVFNLDESYLIKISLNNLGTYLEKSEKLLEKRKQEVSEKKEPEHRGPEYRVKESKGESESKPRVTFEEVYEV